MGCQEQWFALAKITIFVVGVIIVLWKYIDNTIRMREGNAQPKSNKISARVKAAGYTGAFIFLQLPYAKTALDFQFYDYSIQLYSIVNAGMLLATLWYGGITGGTYLTNIKGNGSVNN